MSGSYENIVLLITQEFLFLIIAVCKLNPFMVFSDNEE